MSTINKKKAAVMAVLAVAIAIIFAGPIALGSQSHHASACGWGGCGGWGDGGCCGGCWNGCGGWGWGGDDWGGWDD
jgi:hypothetical protein